MEKMSILQKSAILALALLTGWTGLRAQDVLTGYETPETRQEATYRPATSPHPDSFRRARELYDHGMYAEAKRAFETISDDPIARGWAVLCAVALKQDDAPTLMDRYFAEAPFSTVIPQILYRHAGNLFERGEYEEAVTIYETIDEKDLYAEQRPDYRFRRAFSAFQVGAYEAAEPLFENLADGPLTDFSAPSRYCLGYINYDRENFSAARKWFAQSAKDPRFEDISNYYLIECAFMDKDYAYVTEHGPLLAETAPDDRQPHLARLISEAYLIQGDTEGAEAYYRKALQDNPAKDRGDYFFAGSVMYAIGDYKGAVENFSQMSERTDSLGQIASYQMAYSYIKIKDKVSALDAFKEAAVPQFDQTIAEDAYFNYAKLSFDLNHDPSVFESYLEKYPAKEKSEQIWQYIALAALYNNDYQGAIDAYDNLESLDRASGANYVRANYLRARQLIASGAWRPAQEYLKAVDFYTDRRESLNQLARYWLAQSYYNDEKYDKAAKELTALYALSALDGQPEGNQIPYDLAYTYFRQENYAEAARWFDNYTKMPNALEKADAAIRRADCDFYSKDYRSAISRYDDILSGGIDPNNIYPYYQDAMACGLTGKDTKKMDLLEHVLDADPSSLWYDQAMYELGMTYIDKNENGSAVRVFKQLRSASSDPIVQSRALLQLGTVYNRMDEPSKALVAFKEVVTTQPGTPFAESALLAIESVYRDLGQPELYLDYVASIGQAPNMSESEREELYFSSAEQVFQTGNYSGALNSLENFKKRFPKGKKLGMADFYIAECYRQLGRFDQARDTYSLAIDEGDDEPYVKDAMRRYSDLSYQMEQYKDAYRGYAALFDMGDETDGGMPDRAFAAGMLRSAWKARMYPETVQAADFVRQYPNLDPALRREADYLCAKSYLATSRRSEAFHLFRSLAADTMTPEGAEAAYIVIQDVYDQGRFTEVPDLVFKHFKTGDEDFYWMARAYIVLADSYADMDNFKQARRTFESIRDIYPASAKDDILPTVQSRLKQLDELNQ